MALEQWMLTCFLAVAEELHFGRAADRGISRILRSRSAVAYVPLDDLRDFLDELCGAGLPEATAIAVVELPMLEQVRVLRGPARARDLAEHRSL